MKRLLFIIALLLPVFAQAVTFVTTTEPNGTIHFRSLQVQEEYCVVTAIYSGNESCTISIIAEGQKMSNPASIARQEQDRTVHVEAVVEFDDPTINSISKSIDYTIPALNIDPIGEIVFNDLLLEEDACTVSASYTGPEPCTVTIFYNGIRLGNPTQFGRIDIDFIVELEAQAVFNERRIRTISKTATITIPARVHTSPYGEITLSPIEAYTPNNVIDLYGDEGFEKMFDLNWQTKWCVENRSGSWQPIWVDFKSNVPFIPISYMLTTGDDTDTFKNRNPKAWKIYGKAKKNDEWTTLVEVTDGAAAGLGTEYNQDYFFEIYGPIKMFQYFRFEVDEVCGADGWNPNYYVFQLAEFAIGGPTNVPDMPVTGDLNGDGIVDVTDVSIIIDMVLGKVEKDLEKADLTGDGEIDVSDVSSLIDIVLGKV